MQKAFGLAFLWGSFTAALYYFIFEFHGHDRFSKAYVMYFAHTSGVVVFYAITVFAPIKYVYRRPALRIYAIYQIIENTTWIGVTTLLYLDIQFGFCLQLVSTVSMQGLLQSLFIYYALVEDSNVSELNVHVDEYQRILHLNLYIIVIIDDVPYSTTNKFSFVSRVIIPHLLSCSVLARYWKLQSSGGNVGNRRGHS
jgi:hypothetical protein